MNIRFHIDPRSGEPHIYDHGVNEDEVEQVLANRGEDPKPDSVFVVTAYELSGKPLKAYRRRIGKK